MQTLNGSYLEELAIKNANNDLRSNYVVRSANKKQPTYPKLDIHQQSIHTQRQIGGAKLNMDNLMMNGLISTHQGKLDKVMRGDRDYAN